MVMHSTHGSKRMDDHPTCCTHCALSFWFLALSTAFSALDRCCFFSLRRCTNSRIG